LADRVRMDRQRATPIEDTTLALLDQVSETWNLDGGNAGHFLSWTAHLHEIGLDIARNHLHGEYIALHADLLGFSLPEQRLLATLVRTHWRKFPMTTTRALPAVGQSGVSI